MSIKRYRHNTPLKIKNFRKLNTRKGLADMSAVLQIDRYRTEVKNPRINTFSLVDMIFDPVKRSAIYEQYDKDCSDTDEQREIAEAFKKRRLRGK